MMQESAANTGNDVALEVQSNVEKPEPIGFSAAVLCCYINATSRIQVARLSHLCEGDWEHILFPGQRFLFEAPPEVMLTIYKSPTLSTTPPEYIPCHTLQVESG